jgi:hypothetical protein
MDSGHSLAVTVYAGKSSKTLLSSNLYLGRKRLIVNAFDANQPARHPP